MANEFKVKNGLIVDTLAGTGTRMVVTDANGLMSTQAISSGSSAASSAEQLTVTGTQNGTNKVFTLSSAPSGVYFVFLNGAKLVETMDYSVSSTTLTLSSSCPAPGASDQLEVFSAVAGTSGTGSSDVVKLGGSTWASASEVNIVFSSYIATYRKIVIVFPLIYGNTDAVDIQMRTSQDGTTYDSGSFDYVYGGTRRAGNFSGSTSQITLLPNVGVSTGKGHSLEIKVMDPNQSAMHGRVVWEGGYHSGSSEFGNPSPVNGYGFRGTAAQIKAIKLYPSSGTFYGEYQIWGHK